MVPSLVALCLLRLYPYANEIYQLPVQLNLRNGRRLLDELVPDHAQLDPRLWATLVQVYTRLPPAFAEHHLPFDDDHLPLLQAIPPSSLFSLVTVLQLPACHYFTDTTLLQLRSLHSLSALDVSQTTVSAHGLKSLAATMQLNDHDNPLGHRGPWLLRVLCLRDCHRITNDLFPVLDQFPLLSVVDLRGTQCIPAQASTAFARSADSNLFHPSTPSAVLSTLKSIQPNLHSSSNSHILNINALNHPQTHRPGAAPQDVFVVLPSNHARIQVGNSHVLAQQTEAREQALAHERNKEAWYQRQEILEARAYQGELDQNPKVKTSPRQPMAEAARISRSSWSGDIPLSHLVENRMKAADALPRSAMHSRPFMTPSGAAALTLRQRLPEHSSSVSDHQHPRDRTEVNRPAKSCPPSKMLEQCSSNLSVKLTHGDTCVHNAVALNRSDDKRELIDVTGPRVKKNTPQTTSSLSEPRRILDMEEISPPSIPSRDGRIVRTPTLPLLSAGPPTNQGPSPSSFFASLHQPKKGKQGGRVQLSHITTQSYLMLYRPPPAYSALADALAQARLREKEAQQRLENRHLQKKEEVAMVDMMGEKAATAKRRLDEIMHQEMAARQKSRKMSHKQDSASAANSSQLVESRNPFRRRKVSSITATEDGGGVSTPPSNVQSKPMMLISSVKIPTPPNELIPTKNASRTRDSISGKPQSPPPTLKNTSASVNRRGKGGEGTFNWKTWGKTT